MPALSTVMARKRLPVRASSSDHSPEALAEAVEGMVPKLFQELGSFPRGRRRSRWCR